MGEISASLLICHCLHQIIPGPQGNDASHQCFQITVIGPEGGLAVGREGAPVLQSSSLFTHFSQCQDLISLNANEMGEQAHVLIPTVSSRRRAGHTQPTKSLSSQVS